MANITLNCAHCGAPVQYDGSDVTTVICPFCNTTVAIPPEMRPVKPVVIQFQSPINSDDRGSSRKNGRMVGWIIAVVIFFAILGIAVTVIGSTFFANSLDQSVSTQISMISTDIPTQIPTPTIPPSPTPGYEVPGITFGQKGINPGQFDDARYITTDGSSTIYVADYDGGRVQAFDIQGKYLYQWKVGNSKTIIEGLAADRKGGVWVAYGSGIDHVDGKTGASLGKLTNPRGGEYGDLLISPEGNLVAVWYEGRWGLITSLEGHTQDILFYNPAGKLLKTMTTPISNQTDELALDVSIAMDGKGNLYALESGTIYAFNADGKYLNMFGSSGSAPGQFGNPDSIRTDKQGQIIVGDSSLIDIFSPGGQYIASFKIKGSSRGIAYDDNGSLWVLATDQVIQYIKPEK
jgi:hypothetical protein